MTPGTDPLAFLTRIHGNGAWLLVYALIAVPLLIGLIRGRAPSTKLVFFPVLALPVTAVAVLFVSMLQQFGIETDQFATSTGTLRGLA